MPAPITYLPGTLATLLTTELNGLTSNALALGAAFTAGGNYLLVEVEGLVTFTAAPTAGTGLSLWFLRAIDGNNYEDGGAAVTPARNPNLTIPYRPVTTAQREARLVLLSPGTWRPLLKNDGTGATLAATGNTLRILPWTFQSG